MPKGISKEEKKPSGKRVQVKQTDVPSYGIEQALRVPKALTDNYAGKPTSPLKVAQALDLHPGSSYFRMICGAAMAYGLISGGAWANEIALEPLGKRILKPLHEGDDLIAKREAFLKPRVIKDFLEQYDDSGLPRQDIALNVLEDLGVPKDRAGNVFNLIVESANSLGLITQIKGKPYVHLQCVLVQNPKSQQSFGDSEEAVRNDAFDSENDDNALPSELKDVLKLHDFDAKKLPPVDTARKRRVFITHGKNKTFVEPIKKLLHFGELEAVVSVERQSVSQPVPDKVLSEMRTCGAAIIHVDAELKLIDSEAKEHIVLNPNVLIEIGAAMALYGRRFILLVKSGINLPSNLQGLFEVRYTGESLDGDATIRLLEAINSMKNEPSPAEKNNSEE